MTEVCHRSNGSKLKMMAVDQIRELMERREHRFTLHNFRISERYLKGEARILVTMRVPALFHDTETLCAII